MANRRLDPGHREPLWYIWKSHRHLHWASQDLRAMMSAGDNPDRPKMEKAFFNLLTSVNVARESLEAASDELDLGGVASVIANEKKNPRSVVHYFWAARNADVHDVLHWKHNVAIMRVTQIGPFQGILTNMQGLSEPEERILFAFNVRTLAEMRVKLSHGAAPDPGRCAMAGIRFDLQTASMDLASFRYVNTSGKPKLITVAEPTEHLGQTAYPIAVDGAYLVLKFYIDQLEALAQLADANVESIDLPVALAPGNANFVTWLWDDR